MSTKLDPPLQLVIGVSDTNTCCQTIGDTVSAEYVLMVKAACQCKGRDAVLAVERITGPLYSLAVRRQAIHLQSNHIAERNWWHNCHRA